MNKNEKERIIELCFSFRSAIELCKNKMGNLFWFEGFPRGCCRETATMLAKYLTEQGYEGIQCVRGETYYNGKLSTHVWLKLNDWIIDITADQFGEHFGKVMVTDKSELHNRFKIVEKESYIVFWNGTTMDDSEMRRKYHMICEKAAEL